MNTLNIRQEQGEHYTILHLTGELTVKNLPQLQSLLETYLKNKDVELILLECKELTSAESDSFIPLKSIAGTLSQQCRELALCCLASTIYSAEVIAPPLLYYKTQEEAMAMFRQAQPAANEPQVNLLLPTKNVLKLTVLSGPSLGATASLKKQKELVIGRHSKCDLPLPQDFQVSRFHCRCYEKENKYFLEDLKSCNGTLFQNKLLTEDVEIREGDSFQVGVTNVAVNFIKEEIKPDAADLVLPKLEMPTEEVPRELEMLDLKAQPTPDISSTNGRKTQTSPELALELSLVPGQDTVSMKTDLTYLESLYNKSIGGSEPKKQEEPAPSGAKTPQQPPAWEKEILESAGVALAIKKTRIPTPINRTASAVKPQELIDGRYRVQNVVGESSVAFMLQCQDSQSNAVVFLQYLKEPMRLLDIPACHPCLLLPTQQGEFQQRPWRQYLEPELTAIPQTVSEIKCLEVAISLIDLLIALHKIGSSGFDFAPSHVFFTKKDGVKFALIPAVLYNDICGEPADIFTLGVFLYRLVTGLTITYTPFGALDRDALQQKLLAKISPEFSEIILQVLHREEQDLDCISRRFAQMLLALLTPQASNHEATTLRAIKTGNYVLYQINSADYKKYVWDENSIQEASQKILAASKVDEVGQKGASLYQKIFYSDLAVALAKARGPHLSLVLDEELASVPWELMYDKKQFLTSRFCVARESLRSPKYAARKSPLNMIKIFILADLSAEAQKVKEQLGNVLRKESPRVRLKVYNTSDSPWEILRQMFYCDIIHIIGTAQYNPTEQMNSGWLLSANRLLKLRFFENMPYKPRLIFHQGGVTPPVSTGQFLALLYQIGIDYIVGNFWPNVNLELPAHFYHHLIEGNSVDDAVAQTRKDMAKDFRSALSLIYYGNHGIPLISK